jgi:hypothetical protein
MRQTLRLLRGGGVGVEGGVEALEDGFGVGVGFVKAGFEVGEAVGGGFAFGEDPGPVLVTPRPA